ncbi:Gfo/Idh/MocA family protein [Bacillus subtilis]|uniref:Gfo/Idh/MocA family protein n=1 Tax=Bacillus subtilis TaxID=1423 RepID=UPI00022BA387|nr:Gfo/Idh/MocA family oxidoreductase [Bacillus subtilis]AEP91662.1 oxidoreductase [Bacillus subtilis subsp. subtilis str. RO-NN-1]MBU8707371.1 Gfo/Idh/MocA family oxidoreductase [Bacillus subtilis]MCY8200982.1 Gfo/Idh/MocA family oxidoreductase [Bacillus subtilis]MCY8209692.1 Gfo/Idh/MocA family oxidoreductase [Bacillus subtilis]MEC1403656.1 Gfo/Idh/MocA family oxidoreductase [Bacillus subtilis]
MTAKNKIGVGIIGASPLNPGWAVNAHIPAIKALSEDYELRAVSTSRRESAEVAEKEFGVPAFDNHQDLVNHPDVDLVVVTVKVPYHHELISAALDAGKMVFSEWPLGNGLAEAEDLAKRAEKAGVHTAVGLQARFHPAIRYIRDLIADGYIGDVQGSTLVGSGLGWGNATDRTNAYMYDATNGVTVLSVPVLHALDALVYMIGDLKSVSAKLVANQSEVLLKEDNKMIPFTSPKHASIMGTVTSGAAISVYYRGGSSRGENMRWEINGSEGDLILTAPTGHLQLANVKLEGGRGKDKTVSEMTIPSSYFELGQHVPAGVASNTGRLYAQFAKDIREGTHFAPDFAHAVARHRLLDTLETSSRTGTEQKINDLISR